MLELGSPPFPDPDLRIFKDSTTLRERTFFSNSAHTSVKDDLIFMKDFVMYL